MIPKIIWQTYKTEYKDLPQTAKECAEQWQILNPDYEYKYFSDSQIYEFVEKYYGKKMLNLIKSFKVPVMKSDLWRILVIYQFGGVYVDIDTRPGEPLEKWIDLSKGMIVAIENGLHYAQWAFMAEPKSPIIKSILDTILERCEEIDYEMKDFVHYYTANDAFSEGIRKYFNLPNLNHKCLTMEVSKNCFCGLLQKEAKTYSSNKKMIDAKFECRPDQDFTGNKVLHYFGSFFWNKNEYQSWLENPLAKKSRATDEVILYYCGVTANLSINSGIQRVVRFLAKALQDLNKVLVPVVYDFDKDELVILSGEKLDNLQKFNGPEKYKFAVTEDLKEYINKASFMLIPDLISNVGHFDHKKVFNSIPKVKKYNIFYDAIPCVLKDLYPEEWDVCHKDYMNAISKLDGVISISDHSTKDYLKFVDNKNVNIKTINLPNQFIIDKKNISKKENKSKNIEILTVSTIEGRKNHNLLIRAFLMASDQLKKEGYNLNLSLVGDGGLWQKEVNFVRYATKLDNINWYKNASESKLNELYKNADFTIYPSIYEGFGLPIVESLFFNTPCIVSDSSSMTEIAKRGGCLLFDPNNVEDLKNKIIYLCKNKEIRNKLVEEIKDIPKYSWIDYANNVLSFIENGK